MYNSVLSWIDIPISIKPFVKRTGSGAFEYGAVVSALCYAAGELIKVVNELGDEVTSGTQLYVVGATKLTTQDVIIFDGKEWRIQSIKSFYRNGKVDLKVVYL